jgi:purine catabolism regulator
MLRQLLEDPGLGLELVAGGRGLDARGPVRWAHISEIPDPTPWLEGGEILLTTGLGVRNSEDLQRRLVEGLDARGCPGVGFGLGVVLDAVPPAMIEAANQAALPLFTVPYELPFIAVTKRVSREVFAEHDATLRSAITLHRSVLAAVLGGAGINGVLESAARMMPEFGFAVFDYYGQVLARRSRTGTTVLDPQRVWAAIGGPRPPRDYFTTQIDGAVVEGCVIRMGDEVEAVLVVVGASALHEHERLLLEQAVTGVSLELARGLSVRESHRTRVDDLIGEILENRISQRALVAHLERLGLAADEPYRVLCVRTADQSNLRALCGVVEDALGGSQCAVGRHGGSVYCLVQPPDGDHANRVAAGVGSRGWTGVQIGRSRIKHQAEALDAGLRESHTAATRSNGDTITDVDGLGLHGLLAGLGSDEASQAFVARVLGPLLEHDRRESSHLIDTLHAYLHHGCRPGPAATQLGVHRHTLAYRLERVAALTGRDLRNGDAIVEFGLALRLRRTEHAP